MNDSAQSNPTSNIATRAAKALAQFAADEMPLVITQNDAAHAELQDIALHEEAQISLLLLKILALGNEEVAQGKVKPVANIVNRLLGKRKQTA